VRFAPYTFRVENIPDPIAKFAQKNDGQVTKAEALAQPGVFAVLENFLFDLTYTVTGFTMTINQRGFDRTATSTNNRVTAEQRALIDALSRGEKLYITNIKAIGPDQRTRPLPPVILTIQ
jgi:hypothetical protein